MREEEERMTDGKNHTAKPATALPHSLFGPRSLMQRLLKRPVIATAALLLLLQAALFQSGAVLAGPPADAVQQPPSIEFGELYNAVELARIFPDQKTFADAIPRSAPAEIM